MAMRRLCEGGGAQVYAVDHKPAPEYQWPVQIRARKLAADGIIQMTMHSKARLQTTEEIAGLPGQKPGRSKL